MIVVNGYCSRVVQVGLQNTGSGSGAMQSIFADISNADSKKLTECQ